MHCLVKMSVPVCLLGWIYESQTQCFMYRRGLNSAVLYFPVLSVGMDLSYVESVDLKLYVCSDLSNLNL